jgi:hypothetical protein
MENRTCAPYDVLEFAPDTLGRLLWLKDELEGLCETGEWATETISKHAARALHLSQSLHKRLYGLIVHNRVFPIDAFYADFKTLVSVLKTLTVEDVRLPHSYERPTSIPDIALLQYAEELEYWRALAWRRARNPLLCKTQRARNAAFMRRLAKLKLPPRPHPLGWESED